MKKVILLLAIAFVSGVANAQIYKWVDENGKVHYGNVPPNGITAEAINKPREPAALESTPRSGNSMQGLTKAEDDEVKEIAKAFSEAILKGQADAEEVDCPAAVEHARSIIDDMLSRLRANVKSGDVSQSDFDKFRPDLDLLRNKISVGECNASSGQQRDFYRCISNPNNHLVACGKRYDYK